MNDGPINHASSVLSRRTALQVLWAGVLSATFFSGTAAAQESRFEMRWGEGTDVTGDGKIDLQTVVQVCRKRTPVYLGIWMGEDAFDAITSDEAEGGVSYNLNFPDFEGSPFTYAGIDWGPHGHPPAPWQFPHFDLHFYFEDEAVIAEIEGGVAEYELSDERTPEGYVTAEALGAPREIVPKMGEHLVDPTAPELGGEQFTHTLIWGAYDIDGDGQGESVFIEPMIASEFITNVDRWATAPVALPEEVPTSGYYPTEYSVRHYEQYDGYLFTLQRFQWRSARLESHGPVTFEDQTTDDLTVTVRSVTLPDGGHVALTYADPLGDRTLLTRTPYLSPGEYTNLRIDVSNGVAGAATRDTPAPHERLLALQTEGFEVRAVPLRDTDTEEGIYGTPYVTDYTPWFDVATVTVESGLCFDYGTESIIDCPDGVEEGEVYDSSEDETDSGR